MTTFAGAGVVSGKLDPYSSAVEVLTDDGKRWLVRPEQMKLDDGIPFPPKGCKQIGWMSEIIWTDGPTRSYSDGVNNKPKSWKEWNDADLLAKLVVSERIFPVYEKEESK